MANLRGPTADTQAGDIVSISVHPDGPYGLIFSADDSGCAAVVKNFEKLPSGKFGPIQRDGGVHVGDVLFEVNDISLMNRTFEESMKVITDRNTLRKVFKFMNSRDYYRKKRGLSVKTVPTDSKNSFLSTIKRTRLSDIDGKKVVEYEIACQLRMASDKVQKEKVYQWSVWRRFSSFEKLHRDLKRSLGWRLDSIDFPSPYTFVFNKLSPEFLVLRRDELKEYWSKMISIEKVTDFTKHHCSQELKGFLEVDTNTAKEVSATPDMIEEGENKEEPGRPTSQSLASNRRTMSRMPSRRLSVKSAPRPDELAISKAPAESTSPSSSQNPSPPPPPQPPAAPPSSSSAPPTPPAVQRPQPPPPPAAPAVQRSQSLALPPPPPPSVPVSAPAPPPSSAALPPKPAGARANLLSSIAALRKD